MANINQFIPFLLKWEGGYVNDRIELQSLAEILIDWVWRKGLFGRIRELRGEYFYKIVGRNSLFIISFTCSTVKPVMIAMVSMGIPLR